MPRNLRICSFCNDDIEDYHFFPYMYEDLRLKLIKPYFVRNPSMFLFTKYKKIINNLIHIKYFISCRKKKEENWLAGMLYSSSLSLSLSSTIVYVLIKLAV